MREKNAVKECTQELRALADGEKASFLQKFFRTGKGEYAEGDKFLGITVPVLRAVAGKYRHMPLSQVRTLLKSKWHEERSAALVILVNKFERADESEERAVFDLYLAHTAYINNWDLVDLSAPRIVGAYLLHRPRAVLYRLVKSQSLWERRIAIVSTQYLIRKNDFADTLKLAALLLKDDHDLLHKATGWMLREVGKRDESVLVRFLDKHAHQMPRTALRYSLERLSATERKHYMGV